MKKISLIIGLVLIFLFFGTGEINASSEAEKVRLIPEIQILIEEILGLEKLILKLQLQKEITAQSYAVIDISNNSIILEKNINQPYPIASITKLMAAIIAFENINLDQRITLTKKMLKPEGYSPSLFLGLNVKAKDLLKAGLIQSTNDAVEALTYFLKREKFLKLMNQKAKELEMDNTIFYDAHGLNPANISTASDMAKLLKYIHQSHPEILSITKDNDFWLPDKKGRLLKFKNLNNFYQIPEFVGGKSGYLPEAKQTFASVFNVKGKPIAIILLFSQDRKTDTLKILDWLKNN
jgi:D-alanyl-D-alanine carboxypeptidase